jgi:hypothetical protein
MKSYTKCVNVEFESSVFEDLNGNLRFRHILHNLTRYLI